MRRNSKRERERTDSVRLLRAWRRSHHEEREAVLAGPHGVVLAELFRMFQNLQHVRPTQLIGFIRSVDWTAIDYATRLTVLHEVNTSITAFREKRGLDPIDDLLDERPNAFREIRKTIMSFPPVSRKAEPGSGKPSGQQSNNQTVRQYHA